ncbi:prostaglandin F2-alpha receptor-like [Myxocyprinus asiaticus]|uniref:prostaglandin F2-alpha receptor-like n=1 Tax=Myxocyprinus asiaticus TaxID=70543 RepID=UPI002222C312|nr:prostaglandin F2-alpha receptor-like [Myxocyprinus asiaticus]
MPYNGSANVGCLVSSDVCNGSCPKRDVSVTSTAISMTVGIVSNTLALFTLIKAYRRFRLKSKAAFLLFAGGLVVTDFLGHLINGSLALYVYSSQKNWERFDPNKYLCDFFGVCMAFFGLTPLLLGSLMAVERCIGVTRPLFHTTAMGSHHVKRLLVMTWLLGLLVALLPILFQRPYQMQRSRSWCFFRLHGLCDWVDVLLPILFSVLGLLSLLLSLVCNSVTGLTLLQSRVQLDRDHHRHSRNTSHHSEMICQLLAIMLVSCVCWGPILITSIILSLQDHDEDQTYTHMLLVVRMATWNQILDPWVYILLRKAVLKRLFQVALRLCSSHPKPTFWWQGSTLGSYSGANSSVISRPDFICLDGPFFPDTAIQSAHLP